MQLSLNLPFAVPKNAYDVGARSSGETHGVVLTKPHVVELILDLAGYTSDRDLTELRLLEPSCGHGAFVIAAVRRLLEAALRIGCDMKILSDCIRAFDIDERHIKETKTQVIVVLEEHGITSQYAYALSESWIVKGDFLLTAFQHRFDVIVGNPPYIRIEQLSSILHDEYRRRFRSLFDRADLYVAFIEQSLSLLSDAGVLSFICADRWTSNKYGAPLREIISDGYRVKWYIDLHTASPFESEVIAYPSIFVMERGISKDVVTATLKTASSMECAAVKTALISNADLDFPGVSIARFDVWFKKGEPWVLSAPEQLAALRDMESRFDLIEKTARVGIGVATGNDGLYIVPANADIEEDRLVPLVMREDIQEGKLIDGKRAVINTFGNNGVIDLSLYPRLARYFEQHETEIKKRHVAGKNPHAWFRTIDRVYPELVKTPKLLIPDIAGANEVAFDPGAYHPHHNLYFVVSDQWDLEVLGGLLSSRVALFFVWSYAVKMRGGYLRFQAQYLRRIRLPSPMDLSSSLADRLRQAFRDRDFAALDALALEAYGLEALPTFDFVDTRK